MNKWRKHLTAGSVVLALGVASMVPSLVLAETNSYGDQGQDTGANSDQQNQHMNDMNGSSSPSSNGHMGSGNDMNSGNSMGSEMMSHGNLSKHEVMQIQQALNQSGNHLSVDGNMGPNTRSALREYQQSHGLQATGKPDPQTLQQLGVNQ